MNLYVTLILISTFLTTCNSDVGTVLFSQKHFDAACWSPEEVAKLRVRSLFEDLALSKVNPEEINSQYVKNAVKYLKAALAVGASYPDEEFGEIFKQVLADTFGAHLKCEILPNVRIAYYAGYISYEDARKLHEIFDDLKNILNTKGLGWRAPEEPEWTNMTVVKIPIGTSSLFDPCDELITIRDQNSCIRFPSPKIDDEEQPSAIALPFKRGGLVSITSPKSESIILKFYESAANCLINNSPKNCMEKDLENMNKEMWFWMKRNVASHLNDEKLYAAYGGVLRVAATVQAAGLSGFMKQNIFRKPIEKFKKTWKTITQDTGSNWMGYLAICVIAILALCLLQLCYNYMYGDANACDCYKKKKTEQSVAYANIKNIFPHKKQSNSTKTKYSYVPSRCKNLSLAAIPTQTVYDMNANAEKMMAIIMSDNDDTSEDDSDEISEVDSHIETLEPSPPKIETSVHQVKTPYSVKSKSIFSTSSVSRSESNIRERKEDSMFSESGASGRSMASDLVEHCRLASTSRGLKQSDVKKSLSTDMDVNSYLTPLSKRN